MTKSEFWSKIGHRDKLWASHGQDNHSGSDSCCNCPALDCHSPIIGTILKKQFMTAMIYTFILLFYSVFMNTDALSRYEHTQYLKDENAGKFDLR